MTSSYPERRISDACPRGWPTMDDEQIQHLRDEVNAKYREQIPVHCAACGGEFPGTTQLHNGICDECQKLTHGPNYRLIAKLRDLERQVRWAAYVERNLRDSFDRAREEIAAERAEVERLREALEAFAVDKWGTTNPILVPDDDRALRDAYYEAVRRG